MQLTELTSALNAQHTQLLNYDEDAYRSAGSPPPIQREYSINIQNTCVQVIVDMGVQFKGYKSTAPDFDPLICPGSMKLKPTKDTITVQINPANASVKEVVVKFFSKVYPSCHGAPAQKKFDNVTINGKELKVDPWTKEVKEFDPVSGQTTILVAAKH